MPLAEDFDFQPVTKAIEYRGKPLGTFRGLTYTDIMVLVRENLVPMQQAVRELSPGGAVDKILHGQSYGQVAMACLAVNPDLSAKIMAIASDEPNLEKTIGQMKRMPFALQMLVLVEVIQLTLEDAGGPLGLGLLLIKLVTANNPKLGGLLNSWMQTKLSDLSEALSPLTNQSLASIETSGTA